MTVVRRILDWLAWLITVAFQVIVGYVFGSLAFLLGNGERTISIILMWFAMTLSIFLIGSLALSLRKTFFPKKYLVRISFVALGVLVPLIILAVIGVALNADNEIINDEPSVVLPMIAPIFGMLGFYIPTSPKDGLGSSEKKWRGVALSAALYTSPILLLGFAQIFLEEFRPEDAAQLRTEYFFMYTGIWVIIFLATTLYKYRELKK